jgi:hypothetical protein
MPRFHSEGVRARVQIADPGRDYIWPQRERVDTNRSAEA